MAWKVWSKVWLLICKNLHYKPLSSIQTLPNLDWTHSKSLMQTTLLIWSCLHINSMAGIRSCLSNRHNPIQLTSTANHTFITLIMYWQLTWLSHEWLTNIDTFQQHRWPDSESRAMRHPDWGFVLYELGQQVLNVGCRLEISALQLKSTVWIMIRISKQPESAPNKINHTPWLCLYTQFRQYLNYSDQLILPIMSWGSYLYLHY